MYKKLSVIIPAYKSSKYIRENLEKFKKSFSRLKPRHIDALEIITVIDGYLDNSYVQAKKVKGIKVLGYKKNMGKGHALTHGFNHSTGNIIIFIDADGDFNPEQISNFFPYLAAADIVVGSKRHPFSKLNYPFRRKVLSKGFQLLSKMILGISLRDTQSGLKVFKREVLEVILPLLLIKRYAFDLELCFLAQKHGFRTVEAPICVSFKGFTSSINLKTPYAMLLDILAIRYRYTFLKYYQRKYHEIHFNFSS